MQNTTRLTSWLSLDLGTYLHYGDGTTQSYNLTSPGYNYVPYSSLLNDDGSYYTNTVADLSLIHIYPDALQMSIKITFSPVNGKLLGAQIVGYNGVDKRIDEFSQVIKHNGTVYDLMALEQAYAPPFSSAKDPVAVAGYVAGNILSGKMKPLYWRELQAADLSKVTLVDVRTPDEFALGALKGAVNIPLDDMRERMKEIPQDKPVYLYCGVGLRGYLASNILLQNGFGEVKNLIGGLKLYKAATAPLPEPEAVSYTHLAKW